MQRRQSRQQHSLQEASMTDGVDPKAHGGLRIRNPQDFWGCLALIGLALFSLWAGSDLPGIQGFSFGPGTAPRVFAVCLLVLAGGVLLWSIIAAGPAVGRFHARGPIVVMASILAFAAMIRPLGLFITTFACFMIAAAASKETRWLETTLTAFFFTIGAVLLFFYGLSLQFQLWPAFMQ
ncbi:MAG: tripartite tricarboxylate transporter TctB family protein [Hyphomonadaceae bacterium]|nr:tripartite tricarboxylate transporter TctB family protein [Hyphomonadaceae bacterium]